MLKATIKTEEEIAIMKEGGRRLGKVKAALREMVKEGVSAAQVEAEAVALIEKEGGEASFKMVEGYSWATCINVNAGLVHGIPKESVVFKKGDVVSVDVGMYYKGFHTDTSFTTAIEASAEVQHQFCVLRIADNGPGIPAADLPRVFEKFYRSRAAASAGTGLGLPIARGFVEAQQGTISLGNRSGGGVECMIMLPLPQHTEQA